MLSLMLLGALVCLFLAVFLFVTSMGSGGRRRDGTAAVREVPQGAPAVVKVFFPIISAFSTLAAGISWPSYRQRAAVDIARSGWGDGFTVDSTTRYTLIRTDAGWLVSSFEWVE